MSEYSKPSLPLPEPLRGADKGSFAEDTISQRLPGIARRVANETLWAPSIQDSLYALADEMPAGHLRPLLDGCLDAPAWDHYMAGYIGQDWLAPPWFEVETYFFRRVLEATGYFQPGPGGQIDPYSYQKQRGMEAVQTAMQPFCSRVEAVLANRTAIRDSYHSNIADLLRVAIWGNQADLSMWPAGAGEQPSKQGKQRWESPNLDSLVCDHSEEVATYLTHSNTNIRRIDIILDNSGVELAFDLGLADFLLSTALVERIYLHVKPYPTYVSDATAQDVRTTINHMAAAEDPSVEVMGARLQEHLRVQRINMSTHHFWVSPLSGWQMHRDLFEQLSKSDLLISKGDANYRRWLGDRHWDFHTPLSKILNYVPAPWLALRILKANLAAGLPDGAPEAAEQKDPQWLYSGHWGVIQFVNPDSRDMSH